MSGVFGKGRTPRIEAGFVNVGASGSCKRRNKYDDFEKVPFCEARETETSQLRKRREIFSMKGSPEFGAGVEIEGKCLGGGRGRGVCKQVYRCPLNWRVQQQHRVRGPSP